MHELKQAITKSRDTSPSVDTVHYQLLKHLPDTFVYFKSHLVDAGFSDFIEDCYYYYGDLLACSMAVPAMSTIPRSSALRMPSTHPAIRNDNHM